MHIEREALLEYPKDSNKWYIAQYLKYGSVEEVYKAHRFDIMIPIASYHRLVKRYGIVKSSGRREVSLSEMLYFFAHKALTPGVGIETLYYQKMPPSFQTSLSSLHRIYKNIVNAKPTRVATALFIHQQDQPETILLGQESLTARRFGKTRGDYSIPLCFAQYGEKDQSAVLRVLQQEVATPDAIEGKLKSAPKVQPFMYFDILDVRVAMYELSLPKEMGLGSYKLSNLHFENVNEIFAANRPFRIGINQMIEGYMRYKTSPSEYPQTITSKLNIALQ